MKYTVVKIKRTTPRTKYTNHKKKSLRQHRSGRIRVS